MGQSSFKREATGQSNSVRKKIRKNATWIIVCKLIQSVASFVITIISTRYLGPSSFGSINYAASLTTFVSPLMYLGLNSTLVSELVENGKEGEIVGTSIIMSFCSSLVCVAGLFGFVSIANKGETEIIIVSLLYSILLMFQALDLVQYWFQKHLLSKIPSIVMLCTHILMCVYKVVLLIMRQGVFLFAISNAIEYLLISSILLLIYRIQGRPRMSFSVKTAISMIKRSWVFMFSSMMVVVFSQVDKMMIKHMVGVEAVGFYAASLSLSAVADFVYTGIFDSYRPVILETKGKDESLYERRVISLYSITIFVSFLQACVMCGLSRFVVLFLYGDAYSESINILRVLAFVVPFSYLGTVRNIWLLAEKKQSILLIVNSVGAVLNVVLNLLFISLLGGVGAAIASLITQIFINFVLGFLIPKLRANNILMLKGFNPVYFIKTFRK